MAFEISFLCCPKADTFEFKLKFRSGVYHLQFLLPVRSYSIPNESVGFSFPKTFPKIYHIIYYKDIKIYYNVILFDD